MLLTFAVLAFTVSFLLTTFTVMHQHTKTNCLYVKTYSAINLILILMSQTSFLQHYTKLISDHTAAS